jgi:hypothetical protein
VRWIEDLSLSAIPGPFVFDLEAGAISPEADKSTRITRVIQPAKREISN